MAESFAVDPGAPVNAQGTGGPVMVSAGAAQGGTGGTTFGRSDGQDARNTEALLQLAGATLAPHIKQAQQQQFLSGVQQAAAGEGLTEILKDQPWYTQIFGPSSAAMGARTYTTQASIAQFGAEMEKAMPELAKGTPEAMMQHANAAVKSMMTGDAMTDNAIMGSFVEQLQPLFKRHAKENYIFEQKKANAAQVMAWDSAFDAYQQRAKAAADPEGGVSPEDLYADGSRVLGILGPFTNQSSESHQNNIANSLLGAARKGNFQIIKLLEQENILKQLPPEVQGQLQQAFRSAGKEAMNQAMPNYALEVAMAVNDTAQDPRGIVGRISALNKKVAEATGVDERYAQLIPLQSTDNIIGNVLRAQAAEAGKEHKMTAEEKRAQQITLAKTVMMQPGALSNAVNTGMVPDSAAEEAVLDVWNGNQSPAARAQILGVGGKAVNTIKTQLETLGVGGADKQNTKGVEHVAAIYAQSTDAARGKYFSSADQSFYDRYTASVKAGVPPEQAFLSAKVAQPLSENLISPTEKSEMGKAIRKISESKNENIFGWNAVDDQALRVIEAVTAKDFKANRSLNSVEVSAARAYSSALNQGLEIIGKHASIGKQNGSVDLVQYMLQGRNNKGAKETAAAFEAVLEHKVKAVGGNLDSYIILRASDVNKSPRYLVEMVDKEGAIRTSYITGDELRDYTPKPMEGMDGGAAFGVYPQGNKRRKE